MKRQKRDRLERAHSRGFHAGIEGRSREDCPFENINAREQWLSGWREARTTRASGYGL